MAVTRDLAMRLELAASVPGSKLDVVPSGSIAAPVQQRLAKHTMPRLLPCARPRKARPRCSRTSS